MPNYSIFQFVLGVLEYSTKRLCGDKVQAIVAVEWNARAEQASASRARAGVELMAFNYALTPDLFPARSVLTQLAAEMQKTLSRCKARLGLWHAAVLRGWRCGWGGLGSMWHGVLWEWRGEGIAYLVSRCPFQPCHFFPRAGGCSPVLWSLFCSCCSGWRERGERLCSAWAAQRWSFLSLYLRGWDVCLKYNDFCKNGQSPKAGLAVEVTDLLRSLILAGWWVTEAGGVRYKLPSSLLQSWSQPAVSRTSGVCWALRLSCTAKQAKG